MKKLIYLITFLISISASAQWIDASNTTVVGVVEDSISNPVDFIVLDSENKFRKISKDSLGGSFETAANGGIYRAGRDEDNYGDIGINAFDVSFSPNNSSVLGATGEYSTAFGFRTEASGGLSTAFGYVTRASGYSSAAFGFDTVASGEYSAAFGGNTVASEDFSVAFGFETIASGYSSAAFGETTIASGNYSTAFGVNTTASGESSTAFGDTTIASGNYSTAFGVNNDMSLTPNALFQVGNGFNPSNKNNAYTLNTDATSYQDNIAFYNDDYSANYTDRSLVDKGYVDSEIAGVSGTVESVSLSAPTGFDVSGSPVTTTGTLTFDYSSGYQAYTTTEANKLSGIETGAEVNVNADWDCETGDCEILNKPEETAFSVYNQYSEVTVSTTTQTSMITADTGSQAIAVMTEGASYIGSIFGMYNHSSDNQNITIRVGIGNRANIINETINTAAYTGDIPVKIDYTINFFDDNWARVTMFIQVADITTVVVGENVSVINIGNELDLDVVLTAGTLTTYSSYLHKHVQ